MSVILQVQDSTMVSPSVEEGHAVLAEYVNLLTIFVAGIIVLGLVLLIRYFWSDRRKQNRNKNGE